MTLETMRKSRRELLERPRRIIFNNDGCDVLYEMEDGTREAFLAARSNALVGTQVDSVFYTPTCSGFGQFTYATDIGDRFTCTEAPEEEGLIGNFANNRFPGLLRQGLDPIAMETDFCHEHGMECFCSFRMNDVHDGWAAWYSHHLFNPLKRRHRSWLVGEGRPGVPGNSNPYGSWTAVDYGREEVRDLAIAFVDEVCTRFDIDGVELDFCRHYVYFKSQAWGHDVSAEETALMTDMIRRMRHVVDEHSVRRGRPILLAVRVTDNPGFRLAMGLDLETWLGEDLVDLVSVSDYWRFSPWEVNVDLVHGYGKKVFACLSESRERDPAACSLRNSIESYRARVMQGLTAGVDGIYLFNAQDVSTEVIFNELGDPDLLRTLPKVYVSTARGVGNADFWLRDATERFLDREFVCPSRPRRIASGQELSLPLVVGDETTQESASAFVFRVLFSERGDGATISCNGQRLGLQPGDGPGEWIADASSSMIRVGRNLLSIECPGEAVLSDLQLWAFPPGCERRLEANASVREVMKRRQAMLRSGDSDGV